MLGEGGTTVTFGPESELSYPATACGRAALPLPFPSRRRLSALFDDAVELMLIDGLRLGLGDCGEDSLLEFRECDPDGLTSFDRKLGAIISEPHPADMNATVLRPSLTSANPTATAARCFVWPECAFPRAMLCTAGCNEVRMEVSGERCFRSLG
ncbi:hypothetical protein BD311DRAFT_762186 [Dichomitus squalens]|uniref:Uncharacterized protein n=1 Tax=Dichomitus squalens TaxID=114155 RepID=A0A4Q9MIY8_9APHY|nr:hypothetical protein BD311DRAFT_762186 [Dichomitus squalens]